MGEGGGKALVAGPLKKTDFFAASLSHWKIGKERYRQIERLTMRQQTNILTTRKTGRNTKIKIYAIKKKSEDFFFFIFTFEVEATTLVPETPLP